MKHFMVMAGVLLGAGAFAAVSVPVEQLKGSGHVANMEIKDNALRADVTGNDPNLTVANFPKMSSAENPVLKFDMKAAEGPSKDIQIFWVNEDDKNFNEKSSTRVRIPKFDEWVSYEVELFARPEWKGEIRAFRFDPVSNAGNKSFEIRNIEFVPFTVKNLPAERWGCNDQLKNRKVADGVLSAELIVGKNDPILSGPGMTGIAAAKFRYAKFDLSVPEGAGKGAQFFFRTEEMKNFAGNCVANFEVVPDGKFHSYVLDLSGNGKWTGNIVQVRIDPTGQAAKEGTVQLRNFRLDSEN